MPKTSPITIDGTTLVIKLENRVDTSNATKLIEMLNRFRDEEITKVSFDATKLVYIASSGIRAVLFAQQMFDNDPEIEFIGASKDIYHVFEMTGITEFITFK